VEQVTDYPQKDTAELIVYPISPAQFEIRFRVPGWCSGAAACVEENLFRQK
jgi:DUF1680 family protein